MTSKLPGKQYRNETFWRLHREDRFREAEQYARDCLKREPCKPYLLARLAHAIYEQRQYRRALQWVDKALSLHAGDPDYKSLRAMILIMLDRHDEAEVILRQLLRAGAKRIGTIDCQEGVVWARGLLNDCRFDMARIEVDRGNLSAAKRWLSAYERHQRAGAKGMTPLRKIAAFRQRHGLTRR